MIFIHDINILEGLKSGEGNTTVCRRLSSQDYVDIVWTTCAEFPGK